MEEFFKGLVERARYYEQFENYRSGFIPGRVSDLQGPETKLKSLALNF